MGSETAPLWLLLLLLLLLLLPACCVMMMDGRVRVAARFTGGGRGSDPSAAAAERASSAVATSGCWLLCDSGDGDDEADSEATVTAACSGRRSSAAAAQWSSAAAAGGVAPASGDIRGGAREEAWCAEDDESLLRSPHRGPFFSVAPKPSLPAALGQQHSFCSPEVPTVGYDTRDAAWSPMLPCYLCRARSVDLATSRLRDLVAHHPGASPALALAAHTPCQSENEKSD